MLGMSGSIKRGSVVQRSPSKYSLGGPHGGVVAISPPEAGAPGGEPRTGLHRYPQQGLSFQLPATQRQAVPVLLIPRARLGALFCGGAFVGKDPQLAVAQEDSEGGVDDAGARVATRK